MSKRNLLSIFFFAIVMALFVRTGAMAQAASGGKQMNKDELYFSIGRRINALNESPVSAVVSELDTVIEITNMTMRPDGKAEFTVKEREASSAAYTNKSIRLLFAPPAAGDKDEKWTWVEFEDNRKFYTVDKLFPYAQTELNKRKQTTAAAWNAFVSAINKQGESANKVLDTAKAILKADPAPQAAVKNARNALTEAMKENKSEEILF
jgi:hypothetical protein